MPNFDPADYPKSYLYKGHSILYNSDGFEIGHGSPVVSSLAIDNRSIIGYLFGGPPLFCGEIMFASIYHKFLHSFSLCAINVDTRKVYVFKKNHDVVIPFDLINNQVFFYTSADNTSKESDDVPPDLYEYVGECIPTSRLKIGGQTDDFDFNNFT